MFADPFNVQSIYLWDYCGFNPVVNIDHSGNLSFSAFAIYSNFKYDKSRKYYYAPLNAWQRNFGYTDTYDSAANLVCDLMTVKIIFNYDNKTWRVQLWKGKYVWTSSKGYATGAEIGLYYKKKNSNSDFYYCVSNADTLSMNYTLRDGSKNLLYASSAFHDNYNGRHWWLTSFIANRNCKPKNLRMNVQIRLKDKAMFTAFRNAVIKNKSLSYFSSINSSYTVMFTW